MGNESPVSRLTLRSLPPWGTTSHLSVGVKYAGLNAAEMVKELASADCALGESQVRGLPLLPLTMFMDMVEKPPPPPKKELTATAEPSGLTLWQPTHAIMPPPPGRVVGLSWPASSTRTAAMVVFQ